MHIDVVDPGGPAFEAWFGVMQACEREDRPDEVGYLAHEVRAAAVEGGGADPDAAVALLSCTVDGRVIGAARYDSPRRDNLHLAEVELYVHPDARRHGVARALTDDVEARCRADGRTTVIGYSDEPPGRPSAMSLGAGDALGYRAAQLEARRDIDLPLDPERVAALEAECAPYAEDFDVVTWRDRVPEQQLDDLAVLNQRMSTDAPMADLDIAEEAYDGARMRRFEQRALDMGRVLVGAGAIHRSTGRMVAYTDQAAPLAAPERAYQWNTIVLSEHRGHRLGTLVKLACLQRLSSEVPQARLITTWNALENTPMIRVNDALGARVNGELVAWQKRLGQAG